MRIYPAIDIKDGKCVRLFKGQFSDVTVYGDSPAEMAKKWESLGGEYIHVVDLDGALKGHGVKKRKTAKILVSCLNYIRTLHLIRLKTSLNLQKTVFMTAQYSTELLKIL